MFAMSGQTAESNGLNFSEETHGYHDIRWIKYKFFVLIRFLKFHGQCLALQLVCNKKKDFNTAVQWIKQIKSEFKKVLLLPTNSNLRDLEFKNNCFTIPDKAHPIRMTVHYSNLSPDFCHGGSGRRIQSS